MRLDRAPTLFFPSLPPLRLGSDRTDAHYACQSGRADVLEDAIRAGIDLSVPDKHGHTALHCACTRGARSCVRLLLRHAADEEALETEFGKVRARSIGVRRLLTSSFVNRAEDYRQHRLMLGTAKAGPRFTQWPPGHHNAYSSCTLI